MNCGRSRSASHVISGATMSSSLNLVDLLEASTKVTDWYVYRELQDIEGRCSRDGIKAAR